MKMGIRYWVLGIWNVEVGRVKCRREREDEAKWKKLKAESAGGQRSWDTSLLNYVSYMTHMTYITYRTYSL